MVGREEGKGPSERFKNDTQEIPVPVPFPFPLPLPFLACTSKGTGEPNFPFVRLCGTEPKFEAGCLPPNSLSTLAALQRVPAVSIMSSTMITSESSTLPTRSMRSTFKIGDGGGGREDGTQCRKTPLLHAPHTAEREPIAFILWSVVRPLSIARATTHLTNLDGEPGCSTLQCFSDRCRYFSRPYFALLW